MAKWHYYSKNGERIGPIRTRDLVIFVQNGTITPETRIEDANGRIGLAKNAKGLQFPETTPPVPNPFDTIPPLSDNPFVSTPQTYANPFVVSVPITSAPNDDPSATKKSGALRTVAFVGVVLLFVVCGTVVYKICSPDDIQEIKNIANQVAAESCRKNIKQIGLAMHIHHDAYRGLPPLYTVDENGRPLHSWRVCILSYIGETRLYDQIRHDEPWDSPHNSQFHNQTPSIYQCSANPGGCCYSVVAGEGFLPGPHNRFFGSITDGMSNTLAVIEVKKPFCWMDPTADVTLDELVKGINKSGRCGSSHPDGCNIGMFDGSVKFIPNTIDTNTLRAIGTISGGDSVTLPR